jgi:hypothetical protein
MSDQDLIDKITTSAHRAHEIQLNPEALITAGRRRVRRRRFAVATVSLAVAGAAVLTGVQAMSIVRQPPVAGPGPSGATFRLPEFTGDPDRPETLQLKNHLNHGRGIYSEVSPNQPDSFTVVFALPEHGGLAVLRTSTLADQLSRASSTGNSDSADVCAIAGYLSSFSSCGVADVNGQQVRVGQRSDQAYFAGVRRPNGTLVLLQVDLTDNAIAVGGQPIVVQLQDLVALVTDPQFPAPR